MEKSAEPDLVRLIPADARLVVHLGCRSDALAEAYRRINPVVRFVGVADRLRPTAAAARFEAFDAFLATDLESVRPSDLGLDENEPAVDCVILDGVLEFLVDPLPTLTRLANWLRGDGQVLARIPNAQHYSVLVDLFRGKWNERDQGPLEQGHLRFFTLDSVKSLFASAGLHIFDLGTRIWVGDEFDRFLKVIEPILGPLAIDTAAFATQARVVHYVVRATRVTNPPPRMLVWSLLGSVIASEVRVGEPCQFLTTIPGVRTLSTTKFFSDQLDRTYPGESKIFLQQRIILPKAAHIQVQQALLSLGYLIIAEFDDDPEHFPSMVADGYFALKCCHAIQTSTIVMAETLRRFHPRVEVFPNQVGRLPRPRVRPRHHGDSGTLPVTLFFGALNREADWAPLMLALNQVLDMHGSAVSVQVVYDRDFYDALDTPHKRFEPLCRYERYHELLESADIVLSPLEPSRFNMHKSDLKFIEAAAHGAAVLAAPITYESSIQHGRTGLIFRSIEEFSAHLDRLIRDAPFREQIGENARRYVTEHRLLSQHFRTRYEWYKSLVGRLDELNAELKDRVPEIFVKPSRKQVK